MRVGFGSPPVDVIRKTRSVKPYAFGHQPFLLNPRILAGSPNPTPRTDHAMPRQPNRTSAHGSRDLTWSCTHDAADIPV